MASEAERQPLLHPSQGQLAPRCNDVSAKTIRKIIRRLKYLVIKLIPIQVAESTLTDPTSDIITPAVVSTFYKSAGDFEETIPFCLLEARRSFRQDALKDPSDYDENMARGLACEVLARRVVQQFKPSEQPTVMCSRFHYVEADGDLSLPTSALESAVDQHCPFFLSSDVSQKCVFALWDGRLVQAEDDEGHLVYNLYNRRGSFIDHFDPARLGVPRYQNWLKIALWIVFLICYAIALQTPEREWGLEDVILYVQLAGYMLEDIVKVWKIGFVALQFWTFVNMSIYALLLVAFSYRVADIKIVDSERAMEYRRLSFQFLSLAAPLIWMKLLTVFDLFTYFGCLQIVVFRMLRESAIFFTLLGLLAIGFAQALTGLDASDNTPHSSTQALTRSLVEGLLGSPAFDMFAKDEGEIVWPFGMILYYAWCFLTLVILLNVLVALFGSAYGDITDDAVSQYMAFFSQKVVSAIRAPDNYVYVAPFNLIEVVILPLEPVLDKQHYAIVNRVLLRILFWPVLTVISLFETRIAARVQQEEVNALDDAEEEYEEDPEPDEEDHDSGSISKIKFEDLIKCFPDSTSSKAADILKHVKELEIKVADLQEKLSVKET